MQDDPQDKLYDILVAEGVIDYMLFEELSGQMLIKNHGYTEDDLENMSIDDVREKVEDILGVILEDSDPDGLDRVCLVGFRPLKKN